MSVEIKPGERGEEDGCEQRWVLIFSVCPRWRGFE
jgi:hypothetical protein